MKLLIALVISLFLFVSLSAADKDDDRKAEKHHKGDRDGDKEEKHHKGDQDGDKEGEKHHKGDRDGEAKQSAQLRKTQRIFKAYDKDGSKSVSFDEWLKMKEGKMDATRRAREKKWFDQADKSADGAITVKEFHLWLNRRNLREGNEKKNKDRE